MRTPVLVIGGGLSGLAAAIRVARFTPDVVLVEKHFRLGGLNSYFHRHNTLFETGLHAITNYAEPQDKRAPLNRMFRQLKLRRKDFSLCQQFQSKIVFTNKESLRFSNDVNLLLTEIADKFPRAADNLQKLLTFLTEFDPFIVAPFRSAKAFLTDMLADKLLVDMLLCPLMYYGSSHEDDMDLGQFAIMFRAIFLEGMFRPEGTIKDFLDLLSGHLQSLGGRIRTNCGVNRIRHQSSGSIAILDSGEEIECDYILSTIGYRETMALLGEDEAEGPDNVRLGFMETIFELEDRPGSNPALDSTIIFYNEREQFAYRSPDDFVDFTSGVICFPGNFHGLVTGTGKEIRSTHLASYSRWKELYGDTAAYLLKKETCSTESLARVENIVGNFSSSIVYRNSFTPVTIERYTAKIEGAIYGDPEKIKDGYLGYNNIFLAGTDQGFLGIVGSMLSGISIVNQHILPQL